MATAAAGTGESLEVRKTIAAPREKVFDAWTRPEAVKHWFPPSGFEAAPTDIDLRPGGTWRWGVRHLPDGEPFWATGTFEVVDPPKRLVYTWIWSTRKDGKTTRVTVDFHDRSGKTEVVLRHDRFPDVNMRNEHQQGWTHCFEQLEEYLKKEKTQ